MLKYTLFPHTYVHKHRSTSFHTTSISTPPPLTSPLQHCVTLHLTSPSSLILTDCPVHSQKYNTEIAVVRQSNEALQTSTEELQAPGNTAHSRIERKARSAHTHTQCYWHSIPVFTAVIHWHQIVDPLDCANKQPVDTWYSSTDL